MVPRRALELRQFIGYILRWRPFAQAHYSQEGEDVLLQRIFADQAKGFYVDIGSHHPQRLSNTYWAYRRGWSGINIDAAPGSSKNFKRSRPRDINIERCIAEHDGYVDFFVFPEAALNTAGSDRRNFIEEQTSTPGRILRVEAEPLAKILRENMPASVTVIDLMSIDIEGSEMAALRSNDWDRFKPRVLVVEILGRTLQTLDSAEEVAFLRTMGFVPVAMMYHSAFFVSDRELLKDWTLSHLGEPDG